MLCCVRLDDMQFSSKSGSLLQAGGGVRPQF